MTAQELTAFMKKWNIKQRNIAVLFGMPQGSVSRFLTGKRRISEYYSKSFYYFSLLSEQQQQAEVDKVKEA